MAPVVCMADFQMPRTDAAYPHTRRRQRNRPSVGIVEKYRTLKIRQMSVARPRVRASHGATPLSPSSSSCPISASDASDDVGHETNHPEPSFSTRGPIEREQQWIILKRRAGLLNIIARTLDLVRRNHILEKKVEALKLETRSFVNSVLNNPENRTINVRICDSPSSCHESTSDEKSTKFSVIPDNRIEESRRIFNDQSLGKTNMECGIQSADTMVH